MQMARHGILREDAIIRVFNEDNGARIMPITRPPTPPTVPPPGDFDFEDFDWEDMTLDTPPEDDPRMDR